MIKNKINKKKFFHFSFIILLFIFVLVLSSSAAYSQNDHLVLLAVSELPNGTMIGSTADLFLQIQDGSGRIFMDTYPVSKFDTQLSTRYARDVACKFAKYDCTKHDFLYTIRAESSFIGGPSASAAISTLTYAKLKNLEVDDSVAITGTINSGRLIGNVGGIKEKIQGAAKSGLRKVLIPVTEIGNKLKIDKNNYSSPVNINISVINNVSVNSTQINNDSDDMLEYGESLGIEVVGISDLEEALYHLTGTSFENNEVTLEINEEYVNTMKTISENLCKRSDELLELIKNFNFTNKNYKASSDTINQYYLNNNLSEEDNITNKDTLAVKNSLLNNKYLFTLYNSSLDQLKKSKTAIGLELYYSAASFCYSANVNLQNIYLTSIDRSHEDNVLHLDEIQGALLLFKGNIENKTPQTIPELQTIIILKDRINEAQEYIDSAYEINFTNVSYNKDYNENTTEFEIKNRQILSSLSWAIERLYTTSEWARFLELEGKKLDISDEDLIKSCIALREETSMRIQYAKLFIPGLDSKLNKLSELSISDPTYCISESSLIKAEVNALVSTMGLEKDMVKDLVLRKLSKAANVLSEETKAGRFPILGYSYYEYAKSLYETATINALIYSEYALELSDLDIYLSSDKLDHYSNSYTKKFFILKNGIPFTIGGMLSLLNRMIPLILIIIFSYILGIKSTVQYYKKNNLLKLNKKSSKQKNKIKLNNLKK